MNERNNKIARIRADPAIFQWIKSLSIVRICIHFVYFYQPNGKHRRDTEKQIEFQVIVVNMLCRHMIKIK